MKNISLLFVMVILLLNGTGYAGDKFTKTGDRISDDTKVSVLSSDVNKTIISVDVSGFYEAKSNEGDAVYDKIYLKDYTSLGETGQASLPVIVKMVAIPNNKDVKINILNTQSEEFDGYNISSMQEFPMRDGVRDGSSISSFTKDAGYYSANNLMPSQLVEVKEIAAFRDYRIAIIAIHPMQYNPAERTLKVYSDIEFEMEYTGTNSTNNVINSNPSESRSFQKLYEKLILNYEQVRINGTNEAPNMVIVTTDELYPGVVPFAEWKTQKGIQTTIVKLSDISTSTPTQTQVKAYLQTLYNGADRPEFIMIIGDAAGQSVVPWFPTGWFETDHPYSCLEGTDILPDVAVGRISVQNLADLNNVVTKLLNYEKLPNTAQTEWYKRAFILHSNDGIDPINGQVAKNVFLNEGGFTNVDMVSPSASQSQITSYLNGGVSWVWFIGHGSEMAWEVPYWNMSNMTSLTNNYKVPSIISIACSNANLDFSPTSNSFSEGFMNRGVTNSAGNVCAATEVCAFYTTDTLGRYMLYGYFREGMSDFGTMMNYGKISAFNFFGGNSTVNETINQFIIVGDPTQEAYSDVPKTLTVTSSQNDGTNALISVNVRSSGSNVENALVAINQNGVLKASGYTNAQGDYEFSSNLLQNGFPVQAVVTGKNYAPFIQDIITNVTHVSEIPAKYELSQNYPNPFNPSTVIKFGLPQNGYVTLKVYDVIGKEVAQLVNGNINAGTYSIDFDASALTSGIYFYRISTDNFTEIKKMVLMK